MRGELQFVHLLQSHGLDARRGQQYAGGNDSPDVICDSLPTVHWEVKVREAHRPWEWVTQAVTDAGQGQLPIVAMKKNRAPWLAVMRMDDLIELLRRARDVL